MRQIILSVKAGHDGRSPITIHLSLRLGCTALQAILRLLPSTLGSLNDQSIRRPEGSSPTGEAPTGEGRTDRGRHHGRRGDWVWTRGILWFFGRFDCIRDYWGC